MRSLSLLSLLFLASTLLHAQSRWYTPENLNGLYGITALTLDRARNVWCIAANYNPTNTRYTVQRLTDDLWEEVSLPRYGYQLDTSIALHDIACDSTGRIIVATDQVLAVFDPPTERWTTYAFADPDTIGYESVREFHRLVVEPNGVVWTTGQNVVISSTDTVDSVPISTVSWLNEIFSFEHDTLRRHYTHNANDSLFMPGGYTAAPVATGFGGVLVCFQRTDSVAPSLLSILHDTTAELLLPRDCPATVSRWVTTFVRLSTGELAVGTSYDDFLGPSNVKPAFVTTISPDLQQWSRIALPHYSEPQTLLDVEGTLLVGGYGGVYSLPDTAALDYAEYAGIPPTTPLISQVYDMLLRGDELWIATNAGVVVVDSIAEKLRSRSAGLPTSEPSGPLVAYPNPVRAAEPVHIRLPLRAGERIEQTVVVDALGRAVPHTSHIDGAEITLHNLCSGAGSYLLSIRLHSGRILTARFSTAQ